MIDRSGAATAQVHISLPAQGTSTPALPRRLPLSRRLLTPALAALRRLEPFHSTTLDRDAATHARLEGFDDPEVRRLVARRRTPDDVRDELLVRHYGGPRRW